MGKEEIAHNEQFLLCSQCFLLNQMIVSPFVHIFDSISVFTAEFEEPKIAISGKGLIWGHICLKMLFSRTFPFLGNKIYDLFYQFVVNMWKYLPEKWKGRQK